MQVTEYSFPWLYQAEQERFGRELEQRRVVAERLDQQVPADYVPTRVRRLINRLSAAGGTMGA
ncbi:hypothetical protein [Herbiconiux sp.]|jgi:hypothetical protein|uniref:hypothetical protein n=1 Tax=Herbiconiux sp. TaxID=1871186 RepID=UPI0025C0FF0D|nr:hypothetical protein [Herbiconiux sp.]